jgi:hypothetical protein
MEEKREKNAPRQQELTEQSEYGWIPHNAGFGFLDLTPATLGQIHF